MTGPEQTGSEQPWPWVKGLLVGSLIGAIPFGAALVLVILA